VTPDRVVGRSIVAAEIGCPVCQRHYSIANGVADFRPPSVEKSDDPARTEGPPPPDVLRALLGLTGPGGYVVICGSVARLATDLAARIEGVHFVGVNAPRDVECSPSLSLLRGHDRIPLRSSMARGVIVSEEFVDGVWLDEAERVLLRGLRLIVLTEALDRAGVKRLAVGDGLWVGEKQ
jgi:hypothetical protein